MGYGYDIPRTGVVLPDIPFTWNSNMTDADLLDLYLVIRDDPEIVGTTATVELQGLMSISLRVFDKLVGFKEGACHCIGVNDTIYAIYKTAPEWSVWAAHQQEVKELREEQETDRQVERMLVWAEIHYLIGKCTEHLYAPNYDEAFRSLCGRVDLMRKNGIWWDRAEQNMRLSGFPLEYCVRYLNQYADSGEQYVDLAWIFA